MSPAELEALLKDKKALTDLLKYHVCPSKMKPVRNGKNFDTLLIGEDGFISLEKAESMVSLGLDAYFTTKIKARYGYAKPDLPIKKII